MDCSPQADEMVARRPPPIQTSPVTKEIRDKIKKAMSGGEKTSKESEK
jgi:hypothetical protein